MSRPSLLLAIPVLLIVFLPAQAQQPAGMDAALELEIDRLIDVDGFSSAFWGIHAVDMESGRTIYSRNAGKNFIPASNVKLYTTAAALDLLGPFFRYETSLYVDGPIENGVLRGNLIVRGAADPTFGGHYDVQSGTWDRTIDGMRVFRDWADSLRASGIRFVDGDIIGDDDVIDDEPLGASWSWDDETYYYSAQIGGLSFHDNVIHLSVEGTAPGAPATVRWEPFQTNYVDVVNRSLTVHRRERAEESYRRIRGTNTIDVRSRIHAGGSDIEEITVENPTLYFVHVLRESLLRSGISVAGDAVDVDDISIKPDYESTRLRPVAVHRSPLLPDVAALVNKASQNLYADNLLKTLAAHVPHGDEDLPPGSSERGIQIAMTTFVRAGIDTSRIRLVDGSGLSRLNLVAPRTTTSLLEYMWRHDDQRVRDAFYASLPLAAETGTLRYRLVDGAAAGRMRGKTGSLTGVSTISGYVESAGGRTIAFSIACNHFTLPSSRVRATLDAIVHALARHQP